MDYLKYYILFNSISVIPESWKGENERLCAVDLQFVICQDLMTLSSISLWRSSVCNLS